MSGARLYFKYGAQQQHRVTQPKLKYILSFNSLFLYIGLWVVLAGMLTVERDFTRNILASLSVVQSFIEMKLLGTFLGFRWFSMAYG